MMIRHLIVTADAETGEWIATHEARARVDAVRWAQMVDPPTATHYDTAEVHRETCAVTVHYRRG